MAASLQLAAVLLALSCFSIATATVDGTAPAAAPSANIPETSSFSPTTLFEPIFTSLGFQTLATAVPSLSDDSAFATWNGPSTLFAPTDASIRSCSSCSITGLLREHIVPGLFSHDYLRKLAFGTKIETMDPGRCITVTSSTDANNVSSKIYVGGVEITHPDLFNNGIVVVHGLQGYVAPLSPFSCNIEQMTSLSFPFGQPDYRNIQYRPPGQSQLVPSFVMRLMLRDAMLRLRNTGFNILSLAFKVKYADLVNLQNMTLFAVDDLSILSDAQSYVSNVRYHIVPNRLLTIADLEKLPVGTSLPTLVSGQSLAVTTAGGSFTTPMRINYVRIKVPDVMRNLKIAVHSIYLPFPQLHHAVAANSDSTYNSSSNTEGTTSSTTFDRTAENNVTMAGSCAVQYDQEGDCLDTTGMGPTGLVDMENDQHGRGL